MLLMREETVSILVQKACKGFQMIKVNDTLDHGYG